jgi:phosphatidylinositol N-acetylglucosaminyltransferase subunit P
MVLCCLYGVFSTLKTTFWCREWAILIPSWTIVVILLTYIVYFAIAIRATPSFDEMSAISGNLSLPLPIILVVLETSFFIYFFLDSRIALPSPKVDGTRNPYLASASPGAIPELYDIPIGIVNRVLYHEAHRRAVATRQDDGRR